MLLPGLMLDLYTLEKNATYIVLRDFIDYHGNAFTLGERLTYVERHFLPYHGGHTIIFKERNLYLQEEANQQIIGALAEYLRRAEPRCPQCGQDNSEIARFCHQCGLLLAPNPPPPPDPQPQTNRQSSFGKFVLVIVLLCGGLGVLGGLIFFLRLASIDISGRGHPPLNSGPALPSKPGDHKGVTVANYNQLAEGISYAQAVIILGEPGTELSGEKEFGEVTTVYKWEGAGGGGGYLTARFKNDKLVAKLQLGLK